MKKFIVAAMALAMVFGAVSCSKDDDEEENGGITNPTYENGIFNPGMHLSSIVGPSTSQSWTWSSDDTPTLTSINDPVNQSSYAFSYKGSGRQGISTYTGTDMSRRWTFNYDEGSLDNIEYREDNSLMYNAQAFYSGGKLSYITYNNLANKFMFELVNSQLGLNIATDAQISIPNPSFTVNYTWSGSNVTSEAINVQVEGSASLSQLYSLFSETLSSSFGAYSAIIPLLVQNMGDSVYDFTVTISRNVAYTYDKKQNPYYGYWGDGLLFQTKALSANNILTAATTGTTRFQSNISISLPETCPSWLSQYSAIYSVIRALLNGRSIPIDQSLPLNSTQTYTYQYNSSNFPTKITDQDGNAYTLTY